MDLQGWSAVLGIEPMSLGSPTSPKPGSGAQFLPGFLLGDLPAPATPQPRTFGLTGGGVELRSPLLAGGSPPQPVVPTPKDKSGAPPVRSIYEDVSNSSGLGMSPLTSRKQPFSVLQTPSVSAAPGSIPSMFSPAGLGQQRKCTLSPAQVDPFFTQGDALSSDDQLDETWVTVFGFPPASASYMLLQFAQYGNILKHVNVMEGSEKGGGCSSGVGVLSTPPVRAVCTPTHAGSTPRAAMRPLSASYKTSSSEYQVISDRDTPRKDDTFVSKAMEYMFGW
ncbi:nucleoporin NUP35 isoform X3 [Electrophorus electricus]|uniref:nucleoporin NUP35 isoform X3 n=1 Tax=Electrophorus electricus TaxID=8005 RepID=UPI000F0A68ED|nr:nucleoporin NUP35 isoform X3 [Electrophorus electricus]